MPTLVGMKLSKPPLAALVIALAGLALAAGPASAGHRAHGRETTFVVKRKDLGIAIVVRGRRIVATETGSVVHCGDGRREYGSITSQGWRRFPVSRSGRFKKSSMEGYEDDGDYFFELSGTVHRNRIVGHYRAWEERIGGEEEGWLPRCGTKSPRGEPIRFVARRAGGPPGATGSPSARLRDPL